MSSLWENIYDDDQTTTWPLEDSEPHIESISCPCKPRVEVLGSDRLHIIHHSFDGREAVEWAENILGE